MDVINQNSNRSHTDLDEQIITIDYFIDQSVDGNQKSDKEKVI